MSGALNAGRQLANHAPQVDGNPIAGRVIHVHSGLARELLLVDLLPVWLAFKIYFNTRRRTAIPGIQSIQSNIRLARSLAGQRKIDLGLRMVAWSISRCEPSGPRILAAYVDANRFVQLPILALIHSAVPPPQTQEARTLPEMRLRPASVEGSVS